MDDLTQPYTGPIEKIKNWFGVYFGMQLWEDDNIGKWEGKKSASEHHILITLLLKNSYDKVCPKNNMLFKKISKQGDW